MSWRLLLLLFCALYANFAMAQRYVPGEVIVRLRSGSGSPQAYSFVGKAAAEKEMSLKRSWGRLGMYHFGLKPGQSVETAIADLNKDPEVLYAEPNYYLEKADMVGINQVFSEGDIESMAMSSKAGTMVTGSNIGLNTVWTSSTASAGTKPIVAVIDTGVDINHTVFTRTGAIWTNPGEIPGNGKDDDGNGYVDDVHGWNFVEGSGDMYDDDGHGTHVAGIVLSVDQDIFASSLHASKVAIMPVKFLDGRGSGTTSDAIRAIYYAVNNGAVVLNNSWGGPDYSAALHEAVAYTYNRGALFVAAAGNAGNDNDVSPLYPGTLDVPNVLSVAASTDRDNLAVFSNYGRSSVHLASPGEYILSTLPGQSYGSSSGTSMAAPFVAGTAGQIQVNNPGMTGYQMRSILLDQVDGVSALLGRVSTGGRLNSAKAVSFSKAATKDSSQPSYTLSYQADRQLASNIAGGGGCGTVQKLGGGSGETGVPYGSAGAVVLLVLAPMLLLIYMRVASAPPRRKHERFKIDSSVRISVGDRELVGSVSSISLGGVQLNTEALLQDGGLITLSISSPTGEEKIEVAGRVVWSEANKAYGVAFDHAPQSALSRIADWTKSLQKAS